MKLVKKVKLMKMCLSAFFGLSALHLFAAPVSSEQAARAVAKWAVSRSAAHMGMALGKTVQSVDTVKGDDGGDIFHVVKLTEGGFVVTAADDRIGPVIAFSDGEELDRDEGNPLWVMLKRDLPRRETAVEETVQMVSHARNSGTSLSAAVSRKAALSDAAVSEWADLLSDEADVDKSGKEESSYGVNSVSDVRVAPLCSTEWDQSTDDSGYRCYNIYTPNNYVCGCVATAGAQLMKRHNHPTGSVPARSYSCWVDSAATSRTMIGGTYDWSKMVDSPGSGTTTAQRQAIGKLCYDVGVTVRMNWASGGSGAITALLADSFVDAFGYANAKAIIDSSISGETIKRAIYANLDGGFPVVLGIQGDGGHAIVADGYGYYAGRIYTHLNLGWANSRNSNAWYNLPTVDTYYYNFSIVSSIVYNVFPDRTGELLTGRVTDSDGRPVSGVTVRAVNGSVTKTATTNAKGIYALNVTGGKTWNVAAAKDGYDGASTSVYVAGSSSVTIGTVTASGCSYWRDAVVGNSWGNDFTLTEETSKPDLYVSRFFLTSTAVTNPPVSSAESSFEQGQTVYLHIVAGNRGQTSVPAFTVSTCELYDGNGELLDGEYLMSGDAVAPGGTLAWTPKSPEYLQDLEEGVYTLRLTLDSDGDVSETDESNNVAEFEFSIAGRSVSLDSISISGASSVKAGESSAYTCSALMSDGGVRTVSPVWSVHSGSAYASVDGDGVLTAGVSPSPHTISLRASYALDGITRTAYKTVSIGASIPLQEAVDNTTLTFTTGGDAPWFGQDGLAWDGADAAKSGAVDDGGTSWMETSVTGPGTLAYRMLISSEARYDKLFVMLNDDVVHEASGVSNSWVQQSVVVPAGISTIRWSYEKDGSLSSGRDAAFIDEVRWIAVVVPRALSVSGGNTLQAGTTLQLACAAEMSDGSSKTVTPGWEIIEGSAYATIDRSGVLSAMKSTDDRSLVVRAVYTENGITVSAVHSVSVRGVTPLPDAPVIVSAGAGDASSARIVWNAAAYAVSYNVYRSTTSVRPAAPIASGVSVTSFNDTSVEPGVTYTYWVSAVNATGETCSLPACAYRTVSVSVSPGDMAFGAEGSSAYATVKANTSWTLRVTGEGFNVETGTGGFTITAERNTGTEERTGTVTVRAGDGTDYPMESTIILTQAGADELPDLAFAPMSDGLCFSASCSEDGVSTRLLETGSGLWLRYGMCNRDSGTVEGDVTNRLIVRDWDSDTSLFKSVVHAVSEPTAAFTDEAWSSLMPGIYVAYAILDAAGSIEESDELNNQAELRFAIRSTVDLNEALDNTNHVFTTSGEEWFGTAGVGADGEDCAITRHLGDGGTNTMSMTVAGPGTVSFVYRVSSEANDRFVFYVDGEEVFAESGLGTWKTKSVHVDGDGDHVLSWVYAKDGSLSDGADCVFLDQLGWMSDYTFDPPTGLVASDGRNSSMVSLSWSSVTGAVSYVVYRAESEDGAKSIVWEGSAALKHTAKDTTARGGVVYWYWVKAVFQGGESELSEPDTGYLNATLTRSVYSVSLPGGSGQAAIGISNANTFWSCSADEDWISFDVCSGDGDGKVVYRYSANEGSESREAVITITAAPGTGNEITRTVRLVQAVPVEYDEVPLNEAADCDLVFRTYGDAAWCGQTNVSHDGCSSLRSGAIPKGAASSISTTLTGGGKLSFWMGTSSYTNYAFLVVRVGTDEVARLSGSGGGTSFAAYKKKIVIWQKVEIDIPASGAVVSWTYEKDENAQDRGEDAGFVDQIVWEPVEYVPTIPDEWWARYPGLLERLGVTDYETAARMQSPGTLGSGGKFKADGSVLKVWEDYVAGTDPLDSASEFTATISFDADGLPVVEWLPALTDAETALRNYIIYGERNLDGEWEPVPEGYEIYYNFFKVTVEMK